MTLHWRHLTPDDVASWSALTEAVSAADGTGEAYTPEDLAEELADPNADPQRDSIAVVAPGGTIVAFGQVDKPAEMPDGSVRARYRADVHPQFRRRGIGTELVRRLEARTAHRLAEHFPGRDARVQTAVSAPASVRLMQSLGYGIVRYFHSMSRSLASGPPGEQTSPDGFALQAFVTALDAAVLDAHHDAFESHWDHDPPTLERWKFWYTGSRTFRPALSVLAMRGDDTVARVAGDVAGYVLAYEYQPSEVYYGQIGVRHAWQGRGIGTAAVRRALNEAAAAGYTLAKLDVDSGNSSGAGAFYEALGFRRVHTTTVLERLEPLGRGEVG